MAILVGSGKRLTTDDGIPYMWQSGDVTTTPNEVGIITASDAAAQDYFGRSVAVGCGRIFVGTPGDDIGSNNAQGSIYIFDLDGNEVGIITASDGASFDNFGQSVAVGCGRIVVGVPNKDVGSNSRQGAAYIYDLDGNEVGIITASNGAAQDKFGNSVAIGNGRIAVGTRGNNGSIYIFDLDGNEVGIITASHDSFGFSVAIGNGRIVVGAVGDTDNGYDSGAAYIYDLDGTNEVKITASDPAVGDRFGWSVAVGSGRIVVGVSNNQESSSSPGRAFIFDLNGNQLHKITPFDGAAYDWFGSSVAVGCGRIVVGSDEDDDNGSSSGSVYIYDLDGNYLTKITASDGAAYDRFGNSVAVGSGRIVVGAHEKDGIPYDSGSAYIYDTPPVYNLYDAIDLNYG